jgi:SAM-dependent methyltransferase
MKDDLQRFYSQSARNYDATLYAPNLQIFRDAEAKHALDMLNGKQSVLDIGCGTGQHLMYILEQYPSIRAVGVDYTQEMIEIAAQKVTHKVTLIHADIRELAFPVNHFDCTICYCILPIINGHERVFETIAHSTKSFLISIYHKEAADELNTFYSQNGFSPRVEGNKIILEEGFSYEFLAPGTIYEMFQKNGFRASEKRYSIGTIYLAERQE